MEVARVAFRIRVEKFGPCYDFAFIGRRSFARIGGRDVAERFGPEDECVPLLGALEHGFRKGAEAFLETRDRVEEVGERHRN